MNDQNEILLSEKKEKRLRLLAAMLLVIILMTEIRFIYKHFSTVNIVLEKEFINQLVLTLGLLAVHFGLLCVIILPQRSVYASTSYTPKMLAHLLSAMNVACMIIILMWLLLSVENVSSQRFSQLFLVSLASYAISYTLLQQSFSRKKITS